MISLLTGELISRDENAVTIQVGGIGIEVEVPSSVLAALPGTGEEVTLYTHLLVREDDLRLIGFTTPEERKVFRLLNGVQKVGPRVALDVLGTVSIGDFRAAVVSGNLSPLLEVSGVGKKLAERIVFELKNKIDEIPLGEGEVPVSTLAGLPSMPKYSEAVQGLVYLGCRLSVAQRAVQKAFHELGPEATVEDLIRQGLKHREGVG